MTNWGKIHIVNTKYPEAISKIVDLEKKIKRRDTLIRKLRKEIKDIRKCYWN